MMKKILALLCAVGMMTAFAGCGGTEDSSSATESIEAVTETEATTTAAETTATEATTEETTTTVETTTADSETTIESAETTTTTSGDATAEEAETTTVELEAILTAEDLTQEETFEDITLNVSPDWTKDETMGYPMWYLSDQTGAFFVQDFNLEDLGIETDADQRTTLESVSDGIATQGTITNEEWTIVNGTDAYQIYYTITKNGISANTLSVVFYSTENTISCITFCDLTGESAVLEDAPLILDSITF